MARAHQRPRSTVDVTVVSHFRFAAKTRPEAPSVAEQRIFDATEKLLESTSLEELTVAAILQRAGISRTTFYRYFTSKHQVVSALLQLLQVELVGVMRPWGSRGDRAPHEALREAWEAAAAVWARHRPVLRACSEHWHADPEIGQGWVAMLERFATQIAQQIDEARETGAAPKGIDSRKLALHLTWSSERMLYLAGFGLMGEKFEADAVEVIVANWLATVFGTVYSPEA